MELKGITFMVVVTLLYLKENLAKNRPRMTLVHRFEACFTDAPFKLHYFNFKYLPDHNYSLDVTFEFLQDLEDSGFDGKIDVVRCANKDALDSCQPFMTFRPRVKTCNFLKIKELGISKVANKFDPPAQCPFLKGNYTAIDLAYKLTDFTLFPLGNYFWKVKSHAIYKNRIFATICFEAQTVDRYNLFY